MSQPEPTNSKRVRCEFHIRKDVLANAKMKAAQTPNPSPRAKCGIPLGRIVEKKLEEFISES